MFLRFKLYRPLRPLMIGLVHGMAGSAAVALLVLATIRDPRWAVAYLLVFGVGTIAGMMVITMSIASTIRSGARQTGFSAAAGNGFWSSEPGLWDFCCLSNYCGERLAERASAMGATMSGVCAERDIQIEVVASVLLAMRARVRSHMYAAQSATSEWQGVVRNANGAPVSERDRPACGRLQS